MPVPRAFYPGPLGDFKIQKNGLYHPRTFLVFFFGGPSGSISAFLPCAPTHFFFLSVYWRKP
jgi:hypothetical protein